MNANTPLGRDLAAQSISKLIEESDQKIAQKKMEDDKRIEEEKQKQQKQLVDNFKKKWIGDFCKTDMYYDNNQFYEFLKKYGYFFSQNLN